MGPRLALVVVTALLVVIGSVMVFSASSIASIADGENPVNVAVRQFLFVAVGVAACIGVRFMPARFWRGSLTWFIFGISLLLLLLTAAIGTVGLGAQRWLTLGPLNLQPSELAKVGVLLFTAKLVHDFQDGQMGQWQFLGIFGGLNLVILVLICLAQSDLGTTLICYIGIFAILWLAEIPARIIGGYAGIVALVGAASMTVGYRYERLMSFTHPWDDYYGSGYQLIHSYYAFAQGGLFGSGLGGSAEKYLYLPEAETDFIFSIIGEELGFIGAFLVIALFFVFLFAGLRLAQSILDRFGSTVCGSFAIIIAFQAFLNIGCVIGLLPVTGKPLPFISAGGTSLIVSLAMVGVMLSLSHGADESPVHRQRRENLRVIRGGRAAATASGRAGYSGRGMAGGALGYGSPGASWNAASYGGRAGYGSREAYWNATGSLGDGAAGRSLGFSRSRHATGSRPSGRAVIAPRSARGRDGFSGTATTGEASVFRSGRSSGGRVSGARRDAVRGSAGAFRGSSVPARGAGQRSWRGFGAESGRMGSRPAGPGRWGA